MIRPQGWTAQQVRELGVRCVVPAWARAVDPNDVPYFAAVAFLEGAYLWTFDKRLQEAFPGIAVPVVPEE